MSITSADVVQKLESALTAPRHIASAKRASIAIVLRHAATPPTAPPDVLFIQRAPSERDRFSAHIAFPGGRRDAADASDLAAAVREAREEVGIDLSDPSTYRLLGRLDDRVVRSAGRALGLVLCAFVFEQRRGRPGNKLRVQASEVASAFWVSLAELHAESAGVCRHTVTHARWNGGAFAALVDAMRSGSGFRTWHFPAIRVMPCGKGFVRATDVSAPPMPLWGLSLGCVGDLLCSLGLPRTDWCVPLPDNRVFALLFQAFSFLYCLRVALFPRSSRRR